MRIRELLESTAQVMYHVSRNTNQKSILNHGLSPQNKEHTNISRVPGVYLFSSTDSAIDWAFWSAFHYKQSMDIWEVSLPNDYDLEKDTHPEMENFNAYVGYTPIDANNLNLIKTQPVPKSVKEAPPFSN
jgi:hypothetical protein